MDDRKIKGIILCALLVIPVITSFAWLTSMPIGNHESYVAIAARNMIKTGEWVIPYFNGEPRLNKTPLCYWITAGIGKAAGGINDFTTRLPSALLAILSAAAIFYFVREQLGFRIAAISAIIWSTTLSYARYSHTGRPEMALCTFVAISMLSFYAGIKTESRKKQIWFMIIFWVSFALAMLAKGPAPLPLIAPALFLYFLIFKQWKLIPKVLPFAGILIFLLIVLPWPIAVWKHLPNALEIWNREYVARAEGEYVPGGKPFYYYFEIMFIYIIPYCAFIPLALTAPFFKIWEEKRDALWYHWLWFVAGILVMTACGGKRQHYILPMMPAMAVMAGIILDDLIFTRKSYDKRFTLTFMFGHIAAAVIVAGVFVFAIPKITSEERQSDNAIKLLTEQIKTTIPDTEIIAYCNANASFIYYFGKDVVQIRDVNEVYNRYLTGSGIFARDIFYEKLKSDNRFNLFIKGVDSERGIFLKTE
jgi:4-amino-4-deoxy-L-arabinose transferase-like glycosyltransferase